MAGRLILAIDPGAKCSGWCLGRAGGPVVSGHTTPPSKVPRPWEAIWAEAYGLLDSNEGPDLMAIEQPWSRYNQATALLVARVVQTWISAAILHDLRIVEVPVQAWQSHCGRVRRHREDAWHRVLLGRAEALGGEWGAGIPKGTGKSRRRERCQDELCARAIWAWATAQESLQAPSQGRQPFGVEG